MATDNTSDISENDIIVAFELKNNSNPLAIYLEYQSKFWTEYPWFRMRVSWTGPGLGHIRVQKWNELERLGLELNHPCLALNLQCRIKQLFEITKTKLYRRYSVSVIECKLANFKLVWSQVHPTRQWLAWNTLGPRLGEIQWFGISRAADPSRPRTMWFRLRTVPSCAIKCQKFGESMFDGTKSIQSWR